MRTASVLSGTTQVVFVELRKAKSVLADAGNRVVTASVTGLAGKIFVKEQS